MLWGEIRLINMSPSRVGKGSPCHLWGWGCYHLPPPTPIYKKTKNKQRWRLSPYRGGGGAPKK